MAPMVFGSPRRWDRRRSARALTMVPAPRSVVTTGSQCRHTAERRLGLIYRPSAICHRGGVEPRRHIRRRQDLEDTQHSIITAWNDALAAVSEMRAPPGGQPDVIKPAGGGGDRVPQERELAKL